MRGFAVSIAAVVLALAGCGIIPGTTSPAVWELTPDQVIDAETTTLSVLVTRVACNGGVTGTVNDPSIDRTDGELVITFTVSPGDPPAANCPSNDLVEYVIELDEPVGDRALVDGTCRTTDAADTVSCDSEFR
ncbi:MAG: hypothetical protein Q7T15_02210 [Microcella sp.]|uniref:hypothetical protein n=1 Tax=Microcella sp. TaxID=1913979 RepID=UPI0027174479|nr:hypothetical protein [Microcella sp.]MDO8337052.1 hypothetical protein [Microcella sp.]